MPSLDADRWRHLSPLLDQALDLPEAERAEWLGALRERQPVLAAELAELLARRDALIGEGFLDDRVALRPAQASLAGQTFGAYTLESLVREGGMSNVWLARRSDGRFEAKVAVKLLHTSLIGRTGEERFRREGSILARLTHPHIASLIDAGVSVAGQPYLVLEWIEGEDIDRYCDSRRLDVVERVRLFLDVLSAVAHAHVNLVVHRDIKPSNALVTRAGTVKLLDFGIAKLIEQELLPAGATELTRQGGRLFTPEYAAPEQLLGGAVTTATDVYALGVLLYAMLAGQHPAGDSTGSPASLIKAIVDTPSPRLSDAVVSTNRQLGAQLLTANAESRAATPDKLRRALRGDLDNIVAKALKKLPQERYASVTAFADDLRRYLNHQPVTAHADSLAYRAAKFVRRHSAAVALGAVAVLALLAGLAGTLVQAQRATRQAAIAETQREFALRQISRAEAINDLNEFVLTDAAPSGKAFTAGELLARAKEIVEREFAAGDPNHVDMLVSIGRQYKTLDEEGKAREVLDQAYVLSRKSMERPVRARAACALASALVVAGEGDRAERLIREGLSELADEPQFAIDRMYCLRSGSNVARILDNPTLDVQRALAAELLLETVPRPSALLQIRTLMNVAEAYRVAGRSRESAAAFERAYQQLVALDRGNTQRAGTLLNNWALTVSDMGQPMQAEELYRRAIEISSVDTDEAGVSPMLLKNYALALVELERLDAARAYAERAYRESKLAGDEIVINQSLLARATIYRMSGEFDRAGDMLDEVERRFKRMFPAGHNAYVGLAGHRGLLAQARGEFTLAAAYMNDAVALAEMSGESAYFVPRTLLFRSELWFVMQRYADARTDAAKALELYLEAGEAGAPSNRAGRSYLALGRALDGLGKAEEAQAAYSSALDHLMPTLGTAHSRTRLAQQLHDQNCKTCGSP